MSPKIANSFPVADRKASMAFYSALRFRRPAGIITLKSAFQ